MAGRRVWFTAQIVLDSEFDENDETDTAQAVQNEIGFTGVVVLEIDDVQPAESHV